MDWKSIACIPVYRELAMFGGDSAVGLGLSPASVSNRRKLRAVNSRLMRFDIDSTTQVAWIGNPLLASRFIGSWRYFGVDSAVRLGLSPASVSNRRRLDIEFEIDGR
jgi:hypothetical protein